MAFHTFKGTLSLKSRFDRLYRSLPIKAQIHRVLVNVSQDISLMFERGNETTGSVAGVAKQEGE